MAEDMIDDLDAVVDELDNDGGGLFGSSSDEKPKREKVPLVDNTGLYGGSGSEGHDSDVDRPPLTDADKRRRANKLRSKVKQRLTVEEIENFKKQNE